MTAVNVLVVFYAIGDDTERLALTLGVGAIQAHGNIRLRRLPPRTDGRADALTPQQLETRERMARDYVAPRPADAAWADAVVLAAPADGVGEMKAYVDGLPAGGIRRGTMAAVLASDALPQALRSIEATAVSAGLIVVPPPPSLDTSEARHAFGRQLVALARARKAGHTA